MTCTAPLRGHDTAAIRRLGSAAHSEAKGQLTMFKSDAVTACSHPAINRW